MIIPQKQFLSSGKELIGAAFSVGQWVCGSMGLWIRLQHKIRMKIQGESVYPHFLQYEMDL